MKVTNRNHGKYCALELHVRESMLHEPNKENNADSYRVFIHTGLTKELLLKNEQSQNENVGKKEIYKLQSIEDAEALYESLFFRKRKFQYFPFQLISPRIGSNLLRTNDYTGSSEVSVLQEPIQTLISLVSES